VQRCVDTFFYGLFMDRDLLRAKGLHPADMRRARVDGWRLHIGARAALFPDPAGCVHGMVMALTHAELEQLYAEPSVAMYRPEAVLATLDDGASVAALCFNLPAVEDPAPANPDYAAKLRAVAQRLALPAVYVQSIR
jgi:hypothetical protein